MEMLISYLIVCLICVLIAVLHTYVANTQGMYRIINRVDLKDMLATFMVCFIPALNIIITWNLISEIIEVKCQNFRSIYPFEKKE